MLFILVVHHIMLVQQLDLSSLRSNAKTQHMKKQNRGLFSFSMLALCDKQTQYWTFKAEKSFTGQKSHDAISEAGFCHACIKEAFEKVMCFTISLCSHSGA